jgi:hypothetical protein
MNSHPFIVGIEVQKNEITPALSYDLQGLGPVPGRMNVEALVAERLDESVASAPSSSSWVPPDQVVWPIAASGSDKSELTALAQRHFGPSLDRTNLGTPPFTNTSTSPSPTAIH